MSPWLTSSAVLFVAACLTGCTAYEPRPLVKVPDLAARLPLTVDAAEFHLPALARHRFDPSDGLDMTETAMLAVVNDPDLKARRARAGVAGAQLFQARLLPDPRLVLGFAHPTDHGPGVSNGFSVGLSYDLAQLVSHGAAVGAAQDTARQVDLDLLWAEWQTVQRARTLYVAVSVEDGKLALLRQVRALYAARYRQASAALAAQEVTLDVAGRDLAALSAAEARLNSTERALNRDRHALNGLLGLEPGLQVQLAGLTGPPAGATPPPIAELARRRPDLLALQMGYASQEERVRQAVLDQFPALSVGFIRSKDTDGVHAVGFGISLNLPLFNGNRGAIAVQRATRSALRQEYQARLDQSAGDINRLQGLAALVDQRLAQLDGRLPKVHAMAMESGRIYRAHDITPAIYYDLQKSWLDLSLERWDLVKAGWDARIALDALTGNPVGAGSS